jgi:ABC-2 type transport system ATP-binding protein
LDEPTAGVDVDLRRSLWTYIKKINTLGTTICLTTHYLEEAEELCDRITIINNGKVIKDDTKNNLLKIISNKTVLFQINSEIFLPSELNNYNPKIENGNLKITYDKNTTSLKEIIDILNKNKISFQEINTFESDLEDIFLKLVKGI